MFRMFSSYEVTRFVLLTVCVLLFGSVRPVSAHPSTQGSQLTLTADSYNLVQGQCTTIRYSFPSGWSQASGIYNWQVSGYGGAAVNESEKACPTTTTTYSLRVYYQNSTKNASITINVSVPPPTVRPPTALPPPTQPPSPSINFYADPPTINAGDCSTLRWDVENVRAVYWGTDGKSGHDSVVVCPRSSTVYSLRVVTYSGDVIQTVAVNVRQLPPTQVYIPPTVPLPTVYIPPTLPPPTWTPIPLSTWTPIPSPVYIPIAPSPTMYVEPTLPPSTWTPSPVPETVQPTRQVVYVTITPNPSNPQSKVDNNSFLTNENAGGFLMILGGIFLVIRKIASFLSPTK